MDGDVCVCVLLCVGEYTWTHGCLSANEVNSVEQK